MNKHGHNTLIIVGQPHFVSHLKEALPKYLPDKVVDPIRIRLSDERIHIVLEDAIQSYLKVENYESESAGNRLFRAYLTNSFGIFGVASTATALQIGQIEEFIISSDLRHDYREVLIRLAS